MKRPSETAIGMPFVFPDMALLIKTASLGDPVTSQIGMLDGLPKPGPATGPWLEQFGESVTNVKGAPWPDCVFPDKVLYVHGGSVAPAIPAKVVSSKRLSDRILKV